MSWVGCAVSLLRWAILYIEAYRWPEDIQVFFQGYTTPMTIINTNTHPVPHSTNHILNRYPMPYVICMGDALFSKLQKTAGHVSYDGGCRTENQYDGLQVYWACTGLWIKQRQILSSMSTYVGRGPPLWRSALDVLYLTITLLLVLAVAKLSRLLLMSLTQRMACELNIKRLAKEENYFPGQVACPLFRALIHMPSVRGTGPLPFPNTESQTPGQTRGQMAVLRRNRNRESVGNFSIVCLDEYFLAREVQRGGERDWGVCLSSWGWAHFIFFPWMLSELSHLLSSLTPPPTPLFHPIFAYINFTWLSLFSSCLRL